MTRSQLVRKANSLDNQYRSISERCRSLYARSGQSARLARIAREHEAIITRIAALDAAGVRNENALPTAA